MATTVLRNGNDRLRKGNKRRPLLRKRRDPLVRAFGLRAATSRSNPVLASGLNLFAVVPDSALPRFVNSQLVSACQLGFLILFPLSLGF